MNTDDYQSNIMSIVDDLDLRVYRGDVINDSQIQDIIWNINLLIYRMGMPGPEVNPLSSLEHKNDLPSVYNLPSKYNIQIFQAIDMFNWELFAEGDNIPKDKMCNMANKVITKVDGLIWQLARPELPEPKVSMPLDIIDLTGAIM